MDPVILRNIRDSYVSQQKQKKNYSTVARLKVAAAGSGNRMLSYLYWGKPFPTGARIISAKLGVYNSELWSGSISLSVDPLTSKMAMSRVNYDDRPSVGGTTITVTKSNAAKNTLWEFDITALIQAVANGAPWYGIQLSANGTTVKSLHSAQSDNDDRRPYVSIQWSEAPAPPSVLNPSNNRAVSIAKPTLSFDYTDTAGDSALAAIQVKISPTNDFTNVSAWDSDIVSTNTSQLDLNTTSYPGLANLGTAYWWARVQTASGEWSDWSGTPTGGAQFRRVDKGSVAITSPAASPNDFFDEPTPPIAWTFTPPAGQTQQSYQVVIVDPSMPEHAYWDSGKITSTATTVTPPDGAIADLSLPYKVIVRVWDSVERQKEGGNQIYTASSRDVTFRYDGTITHVSSLGISQNIPYPTFLLSWTRSTMPDGWCILRDGQVVDPQTALLGIDLFVSGTSYEYTDFRANPREQHVWQVLPIVNGKMANPATAPTVELFYRPVGTWLMMPDGSSPIVIVKPGTSPTPAIDATNGVLQEIYQPIGGGAPVLITQYLRGYEGHVAGVLSDDIAPGLSGKEMRDRLKEWKARPGRKLLLFMVDEVITVIIYNVIYRPRARSGGKVIYDIEFDFFEAD